MEYGNQTATKTQQTQLDAIFQKIQDENSRLITTIDRLETLGHKIKDTNFPKAEKKLSESPKPDGLFSQIAEQLEYYNGHNARLNDLYEKLSNLI
jgi:hypothetical protein